MTTIKFEGFKDFEPNYTPIEMIELGVFKGSYFNRYSNKLNANAKVTLPLFVPMMPVTFLQELSALKISITDKLTNEPDKKLNQYGVDCGSSYADWFRREWITDVDPYGWFNWYIQFYYGRRHESDKSQIRRWKSFKARHLGMLRSRANYKRKDCYLKTKQNLLHWAINWNNQ